MFRKSLLESSQTAAPINGKTVSNGQVEVRTTPQDQPPLLSQHIRNGKDIIAIWFQHVHADLFQNLNQWRDIKVSSKKGRAQNLLPTINDMSQAEILEFCKSIEVHPAHLVPWDNDKALSLPTPLLELLIDIAYEDTAAGKYDLNEVYLAKAAIAAEYKRIRDNLMNDQKGSFQNNGHFALLAKVFTEVLDNPELAKHIAKTTIVTPAKSFSYAASKSYSYVDRVHDITIVQVDKGIEASNHSLKLKKEILSSNIDVFVKTYHQLFNAGYVDTMKFLDVVRGKFERNIENMKPPKFAEIMTVVPEILAQQFKEPKAYKLANKEFTRIFGKRAQPLPVEDEQYLRELDHSQLQNLVVSIQKVFDGEGALIKAEERQEYREKEYDSTVSRIRDVFAGITEDYQRNLLNNRVLLSLHKISVPENTAPQTSPR